MSDISIPGVNSKYGTQNIIDSLVKVEKNKLVQMESQKKGFEDTKLAWQDTNKRMQTVRDAAKALYGFASPFGSKLGSTSDEKSVTVQATRSASNGEYQIKVLRQAGNDRFLSKSLTMDQTLVAGEYRFQIGEKELVLNFKGGKLQNFVDAVNLKNPALIKASVIKDSVDSQILQLEAVPVGAKNSLKISGTGLEELTKIGMLGPVKGFRQELQPAQVTLPPGSQQSWKTENPMTLTTGMELRMTLSFVPAIAASKDNVPDTGFKYPDGGTVTFQGITLTGAGMQGAVPPPPVQEPPPEIKSLKGLTLQTGSKTIALGDLPDTETPQTVTFSLPAGESFLSLGLSNGNSARSLSVSQIEIVDPTKKEGVEPQRPLSRAADAELEFEGIKIVRETNAVTDVIPGVTLNLLTPTKESVKVKVEPDRKAIKDSVITFLGNYNRLITDILVMTTIRPDNPAGSQILQEASYLSDEDKKKAETRLGKFQGDIGLNQIKNSLQRIMMDPYKTDGSSFTLLAQVGISTNTASGGSDRVTASKLRGYMEMDEPAFDAAISKDLEGVKKLFGNSLDGTLVINSGAAYMVDELLRPSTQLGGFNALRVSSLDSQIKSKTKEMADYNDYLARYQADLKRKYGMMESSLNSMQKNSESLNSLNTNNQNN